MPEIRSSLILLLGQPLSPFPPSPHPQNTAYGFEQSEKLIKLQHEASEGLVMRWCVLKSYFPGGQVSWHSYGLVQGALGRGVTHWAPVHRRRELPAGGTVSTGSAGPVGPQQARPTSGLLHCSWFPGQDTFSFALWGLTTSIKRGFRGKLLPRLGPSLSPFHISMFGSQLCEICVVSPQRNL